jgi:hypothetical protein
MLQFARTVAAHYFATLLVDGVTIVDVAVEFDDDMAREDGGVGALIRITLPLEDARVSARPEPSPHSQQPPAQRA